MVFGGGLVRFRWENVLRRCATLRLFCAWLFQRDFAVDALRQEQSPLAKGLFGGVGGWVDGVFFFGFWFLGLCQRLTLYLLSWAKMT